MKRMLTAICAMALLAPAAAGASIAKTGQFEGTLAPNSCGAAHPFTVSRAGKVTVLVAGTNVSGNLFAQVIGRNGITLGARDGTFNATTPGTYAARVCFVASGDGIDDSTVTYVGMIATA
jgi:hypothetical protein